MLVVVSPCCPAQGCTLVELYTKRNFRCDCGTAKMSRSCRLEPGAARGPNTENRYNQNFSGVYCVCARPYPDPEDPVEDVMIQCVVCEDWFHGRHTRAQPLPAEDSYAEMICFGCVDTLGFLQSYEGLAVTSVKTVEEKDIPESKVEVESSASTTVTESQDNVGSEPAAQTKSDSECKLKSRPSAAFDSKEATSLFFPDKWRSALCKCPECCKMYKELKVEFLTDESDTVLSYESQAKEEKRTTVDQGMEALSQMDRVKQVEAIHSYNNMKTNLMEYLSKFADNKKVVREEDIREFFETMKNKKRKLDGGAPPSSCK